MTRSRAVPLQGKHPENKPTT